MLDYYLLGSAGLLIEEFVLADDLAATRLCGAGWTPAGGWWSSAAFTQAVRAEPARRAQLAAVDRGGAEAAYHRLCGSALPDEQALRGHFRDDVELISGVPLRLGAGPEVHRVLFAGDPEDGRLAALRTELQLTEAGGGPGVVGTGRLTADDAGLRWDLRRVAGGTAWCIDLVSEPAGSRALRPLLRRLTFVARRHGLIPAMIDRLA